MASTAEIQAELDSQGTAKIANIQRSVVTGGATDHHYVVGMNGYAGKSRWCSTTAANTAAQQATSIRTALA